MAASVQCPRRTGPAGARGGPLPGPPAMAGPSVPAAAPMRQGFGPGAPPQCRNAAHPAGVPISLEATALSRSMVGLPQAPQALAGDPAGMGLWVEREPYLRRRWVSAPETHRGHRAQHTGA